MDVKDVYMDRCPLHECRTGLTSLNNRLWYYFLYLLYTTIEYAYGALA